MPPVGFETTIPETEQPQNHALDRETTGIVRTCVWAIIYVIYLPHLLNRRWFMYKCPIGFR